MEIRLLGPLEAVADDGAVLPIGGGKQRALLAALALDAGRTVPVHRLVEELWGLDAPETAPKMVQIGVSQLRKVLPAGTLVTSPPGYLLDVPAETIDLGRCERLVRDGRARLAAGDASAAAALLHDAAALWRGPALAEFDEPFADLEAPRLAELRLAGAEERIEADLALGRHGPLVAELEQLVARHPLRERLRGQLMVALYRSGRQADALAAYRTHAGSWRSSASSRRPSCASSSGACCSRIRPWPRPPSSRWRRRPPSRRHPAPRPATSSAARPTSTACGAISTRRSPVAAGSSSWPARREPARPRWSTPS